MIKEICLAGACHRGITYIGTLAYLEEKELIKSSELSKIVGVSIGSFVSACYLAGYTPHDFMDIIVRYDTSTLKDISLMDNGVAVLRGAAFRNWIYDMLKIKVDPEITMKQFYEKTGTHFIVITTCIEDGIVEMDHETHPDMRLFDALVASMNFPFVFPPYVIDGKRYVDGGVLDNFPMHLLGPEAVGLKVNFKAIDNIDSPFSYIGKLFELISLHSRSLKPASSTNIIMINASDFSLIDFDMSIDDKMTLFMRGYNSAKDSDVVKNLLYKMTEKEIEKEIEKDIEMKEDNIEDLKHEFEEIRKDFDKVLYELTETKTSKVSETKTKSPK
jgi:NTE family protein